ncbi:hypothetical protein QFC22_002524 [Naganishia vaughanmartiniae]|uniref:Uncharacterized protein n=1 Tax=Naganishia vaughanmartiniae TaxID=1424756 RepID=A0ACC2X986_9TREE|nr:hypothetical protein QFC22_002524 [Naganishia vaughanmartiniae]
MDDEMEAGWSLTESFVLSLFLDDVYSLDAGTLVALQPIHALIFLFKWVGSTPQSEALAQKGGVEVTNPDDHFGVYFANQVINNSCGTLAALNAVMNIPPQQGPTPGETISLGDELQNLKEFGAGMDAMDLGYLITNSDKIRQVHNSFSASSPFAISQHPSLQSQNKEDPYHFVAYVPAQGCLWELDGLKRGPIRHGEVSDKGEGWVAAAREAVEQRIATYGEGSVSCTPWFNYIGQTSKADDKRLHLVPMQLMFNLLCVRSAAIPRLRRLLTDPTTPTAFIPDLQAQLSAEEEKVRRGKLENGVRRNNLIPLMVELTRILAEQNTGEEGKSVLQEVTEKARVIGQQKRNRAAE